MPRFHSPNLPPMLSLRVKLTLYYIAILSAILLLFGMSIYAYSSRSLLMSIDDSLSYTLRSIDIKMALSAGIDLSNNQLPAVDDQGHLLLLSPQITQVIDNQGLITDQMVPQNVQLPVDIEELQKLEIGTNEFKTVKMVNGETYRIATRRVKDYEGDGSYYIRLGQSLESIQKERRNLLIILGVAIPLVLLLGSLGGLLLANQALRPVDRITRTAEQIGAGDLTERVPVPAKMDEIGRLAGTFNRMISRLQAAFERQRQFTSDASHELRTPLAVMRGDIEITLRRERTPEEYRRVLTSNLEEIIRLSRLVEDLLMLARADAGRLELRRETIDLNKLCQQMVEYISPLAQQKGQTLAYYPPNGIRGEMIISGDIQRIKQLLLNLLDNAIKYTDFSGNVTLGLSGEEMNAIITVADTGRGIPPEDLPHIFERFFRKSKSTSDRSATGFGLGLSIVKWIVDSHGGKIQAHSVVGKGTTFTVKFPLMQN
jgi:two-component system, OmpR family, sensor kinase